MRWWILGLPPGLLDCPGWKWDGGSAFLNGFQSQQTRTWTLRFKCALFVGLSLFFVSSGVIHRPCIVLGVGLSAVE
jgi:hypothetical protein